MDSDNKTTIDYETGQATSDQQISEEHDSRNKRKSDNRDYEKQMEAIDKIVERGVKAADDRYLRLCAEFENYKKRSAREMDQFKKFANESLIKEIFPLVDNLEQVVNSAYDDEWANSDLIQGVTLSIKDLEKVLGQHGVKPLDAGRCNDSYSLAIIALELKEVFGLEDINDLPVSYDIAWYEQKAVAVLLALLYLGVKGIRLGPTLPAFISPTVLKVLVEKFDIKPIGEVKADVEAMMTGR